MKENNMMILKSDSKLESISFALLFLIPITINLGIDFFYPAITWRDFNQAQEKFLKENIQGYNENDYKKLLYSNNKNNDAKIIEYKEKVKEWQNSANYKNLKEQQAQQRQTKYFILLIITILLLSSLLFINIAIISSAILGSALALYIFEITELNANFYDPIKNGIFFKIPLPILGIITTLIGLIITTYVAYRDQDI